MFSFFNSCYNTIIFRFCNCKCIFSFLFSSKSLMAWRNPFIISTIIYVEIRLDFRFFFVYFKSIKILMYRKCPITKFFKFEYIYIYISSISSFDRIILILFFILYNIFLQMLYLVLTIALLDGLSRDFQIIGTNITFSQIFFS